MDGERVQAAVERLAVLERVSGEVRGGRAGRQELCISGMRQRRAGAVPGGRDVASRGAARGAARDPPHVRLADTDDGAADADAAEDGAADAGADAGAGAGGTSREGSFGDVQLQEMAQAEPTEAALV